MKIIGYRRSDFVTKEGRPSPAAASTSQRRLPPRTGRASSSGIYLSDAKMAELKINLHDLMGREVKIFYNEYRKPENIVVLD